MDPNLHTGRGYGNLPRFYPPWLSGALHFGKIFCGRAHAYLAYSVYQ